MRLSDSSDPEATIRHQTDRISLSFKSTSIDEDDNGAEPVIRYIPEIIHGIGSLAQNAIQFANSEVELLTTWSKNIVNVSIIDDGPGFPPFVLDRIGEPYISLRISKDEHMGLGIFIAQTLLARTGAELSFLNKREGGAVVKIQWRREMLESVEGKFDG